MKIGLKLAGQDSKPAGIDKYVRGIIENMVMIDNENEYISFDNNYYNYPVKSLVSKKMSSIRMVKPVSWEKIFGRKVDLIHSFYNPIHTIPNSCPKVMTIHDIIALVHPEWLPFPTNGFFDTEIRKSVACADAVVAVSEWTKKDIIEYYGVPENKVHVIYEGVHPGLNFSVHNKQVLDKFSISEPYILSACTLEPRKNLRGLIRAFKIYKDKHRDSKLKLVLTGKAGWDEHFFDFVEQLDDLKYDLILTGYVSDTELVSLYHYCRAFAYVSFYEGFGLPILEAMTAGKAVICSDRTSMPEVGGDAVEYCNPDEPESIAVAIANVVDNDEHRDILETKAKNRSKEFSYKDAAKKIIKLHDTLLRG